MTGEKIKPAATALLCLVLIFTGCDRKIVYTDFVKIPEENWTIDNVISFAPVITDTSSVSNVFITIRTGVEYPYQNIWLFVSTYSPSGRTITDTVEYMLADARGKRTGRGFGNIKENDLIFRKGVYFPEKGTYIINIRHGMRTGNLKGVYNVGLRIEKAEIPVK